MNLSVQAGSSAVGRWVSALAVLYAPAIAATIVAVLIVLLVGRMISGPATAPTPAQQFTAADFRLGELQDRAAFNWSCSGSRSEPSSAWRRRSTRSSGTG